MGNSTITLQEVMDTIVAIGDLQTVFDNTGGWADEPALTIGNDAIEEMISLRFPWKWNRMKIPPFPLIPLQQDYASLWIKNVGWLEDCVRVDINNCMYPPPTWPIYCVRDLPMESRLGGFPFQVSWHYNRELEQGTWPGANYTYTWPIGNTVPPRNYATNITDIHGNILVLTLFGVTGSIPPVAPAWDDPTNPEPDDWPIGQEIQDGSCIWTVADPDAQGFRFRPMPPEGGNVWLIRLFVQKKAPRFWKMKQTIDPIPDDEVKFFRDGCIAYAHRYSPTPQVKARYPALRAEWISAMQQETVKNAREEESKGFFPDRPLMAPSYAGDPGPWPFPFWR